MTIRITNTLEPFGTFPVCDVTDVSGAASEDYADIAGSSAVAAIPDASDSLRGLATAAQIAKLNSLIAYAPGYTDIIGTVDQATASAAMTYEEYRDTPAIYSFLRHDQNDACTLKYQTPHSWTLTAVDPHVHVIPCGNVTGVLVLDGYITWSRLGTQPLGALLSWTPFRVATTIQGTSQWTSQAISLGSFTPPANAAHPSAILHVYLRRPGSSDSADTYTASKPDHTAAANIMLEFADCHVQVQGFGTTGLYS